MIVRLAQLRLRVAAAGLGWSEFESAITATGDGGAAVGTSHPAYRLLAARESERRPSPNVTGHPSGRRAICQACPHAGEVTDHTAHCRKRGNRASCPSCRVVFATSPDTRCPLNKWGVHVHNTAGGLGDAVSGLYAVCGLADATGLPVTYHAHSASWLAGVRHPGVTIVPIERGREGPDLNGGPAGYAKSITEGSTRAQAYCDNAAKALDLPPFGSVRPAAVPSPGRTERYVVLAPFCCYASRDWPVDRWVTLCDALTARGVGVHVIGNAGQRERIEQAFGGTAATWAYGMPADYVLAKLAVAACVVANDSGIAHVGGLLGVPTVSVHAGSLPHGYLFDLAPSVVSVTPPGDRPRSDHDPNALHSVTVNAVLAAVVGHLGRA